MKQKKKKNFGTNQHAVKIGKMENLARHKHDTNSQYQISAKLLTNYLSDY